MSVPLGHYTQRYDIIVAINTQIFIRTNHDLLYNVYFSNSNTLLMAVIMSSLIEENIQFTIAIRDHDADIHTLYKIDIMYTKSTNILY